MLSLLPHIHDSSLRDQRSSPSPPHTTYPPLRRSTKPKQAPTYLQDYHRALTSQADTTASNVRYPLHSWYTHYIPTVCYGQYY